MNAPLARYAIENPRPGCFLVMDVVTGHLLYQRATLALAETKVAELRAEDVRTDAAQKALAKSMKSWPKNPSDRDEEYSDGATEGNDGWATARVPRERFGE